MCAHKIYIPVVFGIDLHFRVLAIFNFKNIFRRKIIKFLKYFQWVSLVLYCPDIFPCNLKFWESLFVYVCAINATQYPVYLILLYNILYIYSLFRTLYESLCIKCSTNINPNLWASAINYLYYFHITNFPYGIANAIF